MKKKLDLNQLAKSIVEQAAGETVPEKGDKKKKTAQENGRDENCASKNQKYRLKLKRTLQSNAEVNPNDLEIMALVLFSLVELHQSCQENASTYHPFGLNKLVVAQEQ
jgi:hypothetical protein